MAQRHDQGSQHVGRNPGTKSVSLSVALQQNPPSEGFLPQSQELPFHSLKHHSNKKGQIETLKKKADTKISKENIGKLQNICKR